MASFLPFVMMDANAHAPSRASIDAAGLDLFAVQEVTISPGNRAQVETGIQVAIPPGYYGRIAPRSGLALRHGIDVGGGVEAISRGSDHGPTLCKCILAGARTSTNLLYLNSAIRPRSCKN